MPPHRHFVVRCNEFRFKVALLWQAQICGIACESVGDQLEYLQLSGNDSKLIYFACITYFDDTGFYFIALLGFKLFCLKLPSFTP